MLIKTSRSEWKRRVHPEDLPRKLADRFAREAADALRATDRHTLIVDCNAIAPDTVHEMADLVEKAGGRFLDAGIIGPPPRGKARTN